MPAHDTPSLRIMMRRTPLAIKMLLATVVVGVATWGGLDSWQTNHLKGLFHEHLVDTVWEKALENQVAFEQHIKAHALTLQLLASQQSLADYLDKRPFKKAHAPLAFHTTPPQWLPQQIQDNALVAIRNLMLLDAHGIPRELYSKSGEAPPKALLSVNAPLLQLSHGQPFLTRLGNAPFLISSAPVLDAKGAVRATLLLANPLDNAFLNAPHGPIRPFGGALALLNGDPARVVASNQPQLAPPGMLLSKLEERFIIAGKSFLEAGSTDLTLQLASLVEIREFENLNSSILVTERQQRAITAFVLILSSIIMMFWVTRTIRAVTRRITSFVMENLGAKPQDVEDRDELGILEAQFEHLMHEVTRTRDDLQAEMGERSKAETELRKLSQAVEQSATAVVITDVDGRINYVNPEFTRLTGYRADEVIGRTPRILKSGETPRETFNDLWENISAGRTWQGILRNQKKNGQRYWEKNTISVIRDGDGAITHYLSVKEDITPRIQMERELQRAHEAAEAANLVKNRFLANISHELRTPINVIRASTQLIQQQCQESAPDKLSHLQNIQSSATRLASMIDDLVNLSRVETKQFILHKAPFEIRPFLESLKLAYDDTATEKGLTLHVDADGSLPVSILADEGHLRQALESLLSNAIQFTAQGGVAITATMDPDPSAARIVRFSISDTGDGIPSEKLEGIFDAFNQGGVTSQEGERNAIHGGMGLGLTFTKQLVELMGGRISVHSEPERGSVFHLHIPLETTDGIMGPAPADEAPPQQPHMVVASHNPVVRMILKRILDEHHIQVVELDGCQATGAFLENAQAARYVALVLDCSHLPDGGCSEIERIRSGETVNTDTPIVLLGGPSDSDAVSRLNALSGLSILDKPLQRDQVVEAVVAAVNQWNRWKRSANQI
ncbi:ATP-binding protein [Magnetofaba australis]|uniref:histidine kinase n=1 Tax=Magnetofaba australis IT-1 TaxID=1434232 RepID=A0A1Y2K5J1_9PROT|nr:ATP-binding protein [Magnetofaba australis]OSM04284.1 putative PAS/PAC sensor hybrid histidine kinase [Magnetofaba australis IT-1]